MKSVTIYQNMQIQGFLYLLSLWQTLIFKVKVNKFTSVNTSKADESATENTESADSVDVPTDNLSKGKSKGAEVSWFWSYCISFSTDKISG